jgi:hypothetical protein
MYAHGHEGVEADSHQAIAARAFRGDISVLLAFRLEKVITPVFDSGEEIGGVKRQTTTRGKVVDTEGLGACVLGKGGDIWGTVCEVGHGDLKFAVTGDKVKEGVL